MSPLAFASFKTWENDETEKTQQTGRHLGHAPKELAENALLAVVQLPDARRHRPHKLLINIGLARQRLQKQNRVERGFHHHVFPP